jgi:hypothetical protein
MDKPLNLDETKFDYNFWTRIGESANSLEIKKRNAKIASQFIMSSNDSYENEQLALVNDLLQDLINNVINLVESSFEYDPLKNSNQTNYLKRNHKPINYQSDEDLISSKWTKKSDLPGEEQQNLIKILLEDISILKSNEHSKVDTSDDNNCSFENAELLTSQQQQQHSDNRSYSKIFNGKIKRDSNRNVNNQIDNKALMDDDYNRIYSQFKQNTDELKANYDQLRDKTRIYLHLSDNKTKDEKISNDSTCFIRELDHSDDLVIKNDDVNNELNCFLDRFAIKIDNEPTNNMNNYHTLKHTSNQNEKKSIFETIFFSLKFDDFLQF